MGYDITNINIVDIEGTDGIAYRCRLKGIGINNSCYESAYMESKFHFAFEVRKLIDRSDGWVTCNVSDIDVYHRILVDINVHIGNTVVNVHDYLLQKMMQCNKPVFFEYNTSRDTKRLTNYV
jgi:hypothetical protein